VSQNRVFERPTYVRTLTRAFHRHAQHRLSGFADPAPTNGWVNDEQFEILETGVFADEYPQPELSCSRPNRR